MKLSLALAVVFALVWTSAVAVYAQAPALDQNEKLFRPVAQVDAIMLTARLASAGEHTRMRTPSVKPFRTMDPDALRAAKRQAEQALRTWSAAPVTPSPTEPSINAVAIANAPGLAVTNEIYRPGSPPDTTGAIGPNHYVEMVNSLIGIFARNLSAVTAAELVDFFGFSPTLFNASDPQILWDLDAKRWLYSAFVFAPGVSGNNYLAFGWSRTDDPTDLLFGWCHYTFATGNRLQDQPMLGHDERWLWIGANEFDDSTTPDTFLTGQVWAIPKPAPGDTSCGPVTGFFFYSVVNPLLNDDGTKAFRPVPANVTDPDSTVFGGYSECFIVAAHNATAGADKIMIWRGRTAFGNPIIIADGDVTVNSYSVPASVPQIINALDSGDARLTQAVAHVDPDAPGTRWAVWTQHTIAGPGGASAVRWYEFVHITSGQNIVRQQGEVQNATDFAFNGAISPGNFGFDAVIIYNRASATLSPVVAAQSRQSGTPLGTMDPGELILAQSVDVDIDSSCNRLPPAPPNTCRWGDYAGATPDPVIPGLVWGSNQLNGPADPNGASSWLTQIFAVSTVPGP